MGAEGPLAVVCGSGIDLLPLLEEITEARSFSDCGLPTGNVPGHACRFVLGRRDGREVILQCGRLHVYEGFGARDVMRTVDVLRELGAARVLFTNAAGGLGAGLRTGDVTGATGIRCWPFGRYSFPSRIEVSAPLRGCDAAGEYAWVHGPCFETRAEIAALRQMGCTAVGMSTAPEMLRCAELGIAAGVASCITNVCGTSGPLCHAQVLAAGGLFTEKLIRIVCEALGPDSDHGQWRG